MLVTILELRITQADTVILPFWDCSALSIFDSLISYAYQGIFFSLAALGVSTNWPLLLLPLIGAHTYNFLNTILLGDSLSVTMVSSGLLVLFTSGIYVIMIFQDSNLASDTTKKTGPTSKKAGKKAASMIQKV